MKKNDHQHLAVLVVLVSQAAFLATLAFAEHVVRHSKWVGAGFGFSLLFGLIFSVGFLGMWRACVDDKDFFDFLRANPFHLAVVIATAGQLAAVLRI